MTSDDDIRRAAEGATDKAAAFARDAQDNAQDVADRAGDVANDIYGRARDQARVVADRVSDNAGEAFRASRRAYDDGSSRVANRVARQPVEALLLAGAIGYLIGWATSRG